MTFLHSGHRARHHGRISGISPHPYRELVMKTVRIQDNPETSDATHWETCRHDSCIEHQCPLYDRCCGEVANA